MSKIYLDYAATTPIDNAVLQKMHEIEKEYFANPSSIHSQGQKSRILIEKSRDIIAQSIGARTGEIIFTSGGTESDNLAIIGTALANRAKGNHIITSKTEHPAVLQSCKYLSTIGFDVDYVNTSPDGELDLIQFQKNIKKNTILVSIMTANNETGCLNPIYSIAELLNETDIFFHTDAIQSFGKMDFLVNTIPVDLMSVSSHKIYGPKGIGFLYKRRGIQIKNILHGGAQEKNLRPGTENVVAIAGFAEAVKQLYKKKDERKRIENLRNMFEQELQKAIPGIIINGGKSNRLFCHSNIYFPFYSGDTLLMNLDLQNVSVSSGSACSSGSNAPSHVLEAMQLPQEQINSSLRFSFGRYTNKRDVQNVVNILKQLYQKSKTGLNSSV